MQVLKDEVKNAILKAASNHFFQNGFENASMREIAKTAGLTVGNLYRYFKNKEDIFDVIVGPVYSYIIKFIKSDEEKVVEKKEKYDFEDIINMSVKIADNLKVFRKEMFILIEGSKGSKYEDAKEKIILFMSEHLAGHFDEYNKKTGYNIDPKLAHPIAVSLIEGFFDIYKLYEDDAKIKNSIEEFSKMFLSGFIKYV